MTGAEFPIAFGNIAECAVAFGGSNYLVAWQNRESDAPERWGVFGAFIGLNSSVTGPFRISQTLSASHNPLTIAFDGTDFLAVWNKDIGPGFPAATVWDIYGRVLSSTGGFKTTELAMVTGSGGQVLPALAFDGSNYLVAWGDGSFDGVSDSNIQFQFFDRFANPVGASFTVFSKQGLNSPLIPWRGLNFNGSRFMAAATLGVLQFGPDGDLNIQAGDVYGIFIPASNIPNSTPPAVGDPRWSNGFSFTISGVAGRVYSIESTMDLNSLSWSTIETVRLPEASLRWFDRINLSPRRFYRVVGPK